MNFDELSSPPKSPSSSSISDTADHTDHARPPSADKSRPPSVSSDSEWVSPFTVLPPLPALRKNRHLLRSPDERLHQRSSSSQYYAAAWGSPYATPSPARSPPRERRDQGSQDLDTASPLSVRNAQKHSIEATARARTRTSKHVSIDSVRPRPRASSWDRQTSLDERFNWLSESDISGSEAEGKAGKTPTRRTYLNTLAPDSSDPGTEPAAKGHHGRESTATITPDIFHAIARPKLDDESALAASFAMEETTLDIGEARPGSTPVDKPLPSLPAQTLTNDDVTTAKEPSLEPVNRPKISSQQSFQRPKKKVIWKGKTCVIALPLTDRESADLPPLLTTAEVTARMQKWVDQGYNLDGFTLSGSSFDPYKGSGQSRALYPDPVDMMAERKRGRPQVSIPDQGEWDAWVEYLKEEKLRALGVTPSNSEAPQSTQSPFSTATLSRVSSAFPSLAPSPPISTLSANGNPIRIASTTFSPPLNHPSGMNSQTGSHGPSPLAGMIGPGHGYKQSMALPRMSSPFDYPVSQPSIYGHTRQTTSAIGMRQFSSPIVPTLQSMNQVLSPMVPTVPTVPSNDNGRGNAQNTSMEQIRQQQQRQQQIHSQMLQHQHQRQQSLFPQPSKVVEAPRTPQILESPTRSTPEIMHPTPRSHRHNLSAALQKGVDDAEAARGQQSLPATSEDAPDRTSDQPSTVAVDEAEEQEQDDLPVLKRPETYNDVGDRSEIETNPSLSASPLLMDDKNPFTSLTSLKDILKTQSQSHSHKSSASLSKFNVEAPEFSPSKPSTAGFSFNPATAQAFMPSHSNNPSITRLTHKSKQSSLSRFNVDAPAFTPSFAKPDALVSSLDVTPAKVPLPAPVSSEKPAFTFGSPSFNVDAPEFKPGQTFSFNAPEFVPGRTIKFDDAPKPAASFKPHHGSAGSIFGPITIDLTTKPSRRTTKALPIVRPGSREGTPHESTDVDEDGRALAPTDRQKRARRVDDDADQALQFAASAPFDTSEGLSVKTDVTREPTPLVTASHERDQQGLTEVEEERVKEQDRLDPVPESHVPTDDDKSAAGQTPSAEDELREIADVEDKKSTESVAEPGVLDEQKEVVVEVIEETSPVSEPVRSASQSSSRKDSSLSALAAAFQPAPAPVAAPTAKTGGLGASRFAGSPPPKVSAGLRASRFAASPEPAPPIIIDRKPSPSLQEHEPAELKDLDSVRQGHPDGEAIYNGNTPSLPNMPFDTTPQLMRSIEASLRAEQNQNASASPSDRSRVNETMPSFEEIDAVMKQFDDNPDLGIERADTPIKSTPLVDMRLPSNFRSDAPSPSPRRLQEGFRHQSPQRRADFGLGIHKLHDSQGEISDWGNDYSPQQEDKIRARAGFFDGHVNEIVDGIIENRLEPLERSLQTIQHSISVLATKPVRHARRSMSTDNRESDADDEDDFDEFEGFSQSFRSRSPGKRDKKTDKIRNAVIDAMAAYQPPVEQPALDVSEIRAALEEMRALSQRSQQTQPQPDFKSMIEEVILSHPRFKSPSINNDDQEALQETLKLKTDVLEASLKTAEDKAEEELRLRQQIEADFSALNRKLLDAQDVAHRHREAHEEAQMNQSAFSKEQERSRLLELKLAETESKVDQLSNSNGKLEELVDEYRISSNQWREQISTEKSRNQDLVFTLHMIKAKHSDRDESRQALRMQIERLQERMEQVTQDVAAEETNWHKRERELVVANQKVQAALDHEIKHRQKFESELQELIKERKELDQTQSKFEHGQHELTRLRDEYGQVRQENKSLQDNVFKLDRELAHIKEVQETEIAKSTTKLVYELDMAKANIETLRSDSAAHAARLQARLDTAEIDLEDQKAKHDSLMTETVEAHMQALQEANQKHEGALAEQHANQEKKLEDLRERHTRSLHNSSDDRHRLEQHLNEKLALSEDKAKHLQSKVTDLEERLEITRSAARAAVEAATAKGVNIPTPAPSVVASPPQRATSASMSMIKGTDIPERISPQALRESIMVLQDQLQHREQKIEALEQELSAIDKDAPTKVKERDTEITMLRELLSVRMDDLQEIIATLAQPNFDREAIKDAAIRLQANLQMQQQLRERAAASSSTSAPSMSSIGSPRGLPLAAAAAWGNWRKARDFSANALNTIAGNVGEQTPSKSTNTSPSGFLAGMMTPPGTSQRTPSPAHAHPLAPPSMRPLASSASSRKAMAPAGPARPLRGYTTQPRALSDRHGGKRRESTTSNHSSTSRRLSHHRAEPPLTPTMNKGSDSSVTSLDFGDDVDEDASSLIGTPEQDDAEDTPQAPRHTAHLESIEA